MHTNIATGEDKLVKDCGYKLMPTMLVEVIKASNRPAAAVESLRNVIVASMRKRSLPTTSQKQQIEGLY